MNICKCVTCGELIKIKKSEMKYKNHFCNKTCYGKWQSTQTGKKNPRWRGTERPCIQCGKMIHVLPCKKDKPNQSVFCSKKCRDENQTKKTQRECATCGKTFKRPPSMIRRFCSNACKGKWYSQFVSGPSHHNWKGGKVERTCIVCGVKFLKHVSNVRNGEGLFCSHLCADKNMAITRKGIPRPCVAKDKNHNWKGGISSPSSIVRNSIKYANWRDGVFARDKYTCQKCGQIGRTLHAHHKKRFSAILDDMSQNYPLLALVDVSKNNSALWDVSNGVTLCKRCHTEEHKKVR